jgi:hypothetical protein
VVKRDPERDSTAAQCSRDAVDNKSRLSLVLLERSVAYAHWALDVVEREFESDVTAAQCCSDVTLKLSERLRTALQCSRDAVERRSKLSLVLYESSDA